MNTNVVAVHVAVMVEEIEGSFFASISKLLTLTIRDNRLSRSKK